MPLTVTTLKMWKDPKYTRGCLEVPPVGSRKLPTPDYASAQNETLRPSKGSTLTALELPLSYTQCFDMSYLYIEASDGSGTISLFGWIDSVTQIAAAAEAVRIEWSVDWWRSYSGTVTFGPGRIMRCNDSTRKRPVGTQPRYRKASKVLDIETHLASDDILWVIISYRKTSGVGDYLTFPVSLGNPDHEWNLNVGQIFNPSATPMESMTAPSLMAAMSGSLPSLLGIASTSIDGAWISPICPLENNRYYIYTSLNVNYQDYDLYKGTSAAYGGVSFIPRSPGSIPYPIPYQSKTYTFAARETTDLVTYAITDVYGNIVGTAPYDMDFDRLIVTLDMGNITCQLKCTFSLGSDRGSETSEGLTVTVPLPTVPVSSSAYSDYVYSGQRDYEMDLKSLQNEQQAVHGLSGAIGGSVIGAVIGSIVPGAGTAAGGAVGGAVAGLATGAISAGVNYAVDEFIYKDKFQDLEDDRYSNQSGNLMIPSDGFSWLLFNKCPRLISMTADSVYQSELIQHILQEGYPCDSPVDDVTPFITAGGPLQIRNLMLTGTCPPVAKRTIKSLLETGIRIQENNPQEDDI